jgi:hypothetical protein
MFTSSAPPAPSGRLRSGRHSGTPLGGEDFLPAMGFIGQGGRLLSVVRRLGRTGRLDLALGSDVLKADRD